MRRAIASPLGRKKYRQRTRVTEALLAILMHVKRRTQMNHPSQTELRTHLRPHLMAADITADVQASRGRANQDSVTRLISGTLQAHR